MKVNYLLPHKVKTLGWILFIAGLAGGFILYLGDFDSKLLTINVLNIFNDDTFSNSETGFFKIIQNSIVDELAALAIIIGGLLVGFSKEKVEDEYIYKLRKDSLVWAIIVNYAILIISILFVYEFAFFDVIVFNMFTPIVFFVFRFNFLKRKISHHEE